MRIIGIDYGDARCGIAISDETEFLASTVCTVNVSGMRDAAKKCAAKIKELGGARIVLGLPKNMDGSESFRAEKSRAFAEMIIAETGLEVVFVDERLSTVEAYTYMNIADFNGKKRRKVVDALSAQIILQSYLDSNRK
ncbi:MAG: Holliday junction resolvase RuvX [Clostridia bacterium]|nr:Holliday junction resolvase RuvX [Clostridia bacterium]MBR6784135.1 Holliday junction resolvase RuvX [Clostridia bacterium]